MYKLRVGILRGDPSGDHEVSLLSAASVLKSIDHEKFDVVPSASPKKVADRPPLKPVKLSRNPRRQPCS